MLIEFVDLNGTPVFVSPKFVTHLTRHNETHTNLHLPSTFLKVAGSMAEVAAKLNQAADVKDTATNSKPRNRRQQGSP